MRSSHCLVILMYLLTVITILPAQESVVDIDFDAVDFSQARLSLAGPNAFLVRSVKIQNETYSVVFRESNGAWVASELRADSGSSVLPSNVILDFATIHASAAGLRIDGIIIDGRSYSTILTISNDSRVIPQSLSAARLTGNSINRIVNDAGLSVSGQSSTDAVPVEGSITSLSERNTGLVAQIGNLGTYLETLESEGLRIIEQIAVLRNEKEGLSQEVEAIQDRITELINQESTEEIPAEAVVPAETTSSTGNTDGSDTVLLGRIDQLLAKIDSLEAHIQNLEISAGGSTNLGDLDQIRVLEEEIAELRIENARLSGERNDIEQEILRRFVQDGYIASIMPELSVVRQQGFFAPQTQIGDWEFNENQVSQTDPKEFFAKLELPVPQNEQPTLYRLEGRSKGDGWVGFGIHIFADNIRQKGYGYGESLLIWFTRDPDHYGNNQTYLEIYRSNNDINMARIVNAAIPESIDNWIDIDLLYQPGDEYITVAVNGEEKLRYKTWFGITEGVNIALRSLNLADFQNLEIRTTP